MMREVVMYNSFFLFNYFIKLLYVLRYLRMYFSLGYEIVKDFGSFQHICLTFKDTVYVICKICRILIDIHENSKLEKLMLDRRFLPSQ